MYNVKIINYAANSEIEYRFYKKPIVEGDIGEDDVESDGEIDSGEMNNSDRQKSINESFRRAKQAVYSHARANSWEWFLTYTFNPEKVDSFNYDECYLSISNHLHYIKKCYCPEMKYIVVPELHESGRYHFHALMSDIDGLKMVDSGKKSNGKTVYNLESYKLGFTTAVRIGEGESARTANYITKYITKGLMILTEGRHRYLVSKNLTKPVVSTLSMLPDDMQELKRYLQERCKSEKTVNVDCSGYVNSIDYINIKQITGEE